MDGKARYIFPIYMGGLMALVMTALITIVNFGGVPDQYFHLWMRAWLIAWPFASLAAFLAAPWAHKLSSATVRRLEGGA